MKHSKLAIPSTMMISTSCVLVGTCFLLIPSATAQHRRASVLPDLSGLAWLGGDRFLAVHDAKTYDEAGNPRISLLKLPTDLKGILFKTQPVGFHGPKSNDLESAAWIPGTEDVLLVESGDDLDIPAFQRIFKARVQGESVKVIAVTQWPERIGNVEATAVAACGERFVFLYAERAPTPTSTKVCWAIFNPERLSFKSFRSVTFHNPNPLAYNRPLVAMDVDSKGQIYVSTVFDAEAAELPNPDNGPFASAVYCIGVLKEVSGEPEVVLFDSPQLEGTLDGLKVESVAIREDEKHGFQIFVGVDDENYGGTLRLLPPPP